MKRPARLPCPWTASTIAPTARTVPVTTNPMRATGDRARRERRAAVGRRAVRAARRRARLFIGMALGVLSPEALFEYLTERESIDL